MKAYVQTLVVTLSLLFSLSCAGAELQRGSVVVVLYTSDQVVMAADSRTTAPKLHLVKDDECKLTALSDKFIGASTGVGRFPEGWTARGIMLRVWRAEESRRTIMSNANFVRDVADKWQQLMMRDLADASRLISTNDFLSLGKESLAGAVFASVGEDGSIVLAGASIDYDRGTWVRQHRFLPLPRPVMVKGRPQPDETNMFTLGISDVVIEYYERTTGRARTYMKALLPSLSRLPPHERVIDLARDLVGLQIRLGNSPSVGGPVNVLDMVRGKGVRWVQRIKACQ